MDSIKPVVFRGQTYQNYKDFFTTYFSDKTQFELEVNLEGHIERIVVKSVDKKDFLRLEILLLVENGRYTHLFDLRYKHPHSPGFSKIQDQNTLGFNQRYNTFSSNDLAALIPNMEERLQLGWDEFRYFKGEKYYKSKVCLFSAVQPSVLVYRREAKGFLYILMSSLFGKLYRYFNQKIRVERKQIRPNWMGKLV